MVTNGTARNLGGPDCSVKVICISTEEREDAEKMVW
jgi:hypothetical protein